MMDEKWSDRELRELAIPFAISGFINSFCYLHGHRWTHWLLKNRAGMGYQTFVDTLSHGTQHCLSFETLGGGHEVDKLAIDQFV